MILLPRWFVMTDDENNFFGNPNNRYHELTEKGLKYAYEGGPPLTESEAYELRRYRDQLEKIGKRQPDYAALWHNFWIELAASVMEGVSSVLTIGGAHMECDELRGKKRLPYQTESIASPGH